MFVQPSNLTSSAITDIKVDVSNQQALVTYKGSNKVYLYNDVNFESLLDFVSDGVDSIGEFVNGCIKGSSFVVINW